MKKFFAFFLLLLCVSVSDASDAQEEASLPGTVLIDIDNRLQQTQVWCWAAVAQQLIEHAQGGSPAQCALVAVANGVAPVYCCSGFNPACVRTGTMEQLRTLLLAYGQSASSVIVAPRDPMVLYTELVNSHPIVLQLRTGPTSTHVVVVKGMRFTREHGQVQAWLIVNDPMKNEPFLISYSRAYPSIVNGLIVY